MVYILRLPVSDLHLVQMTPLEVNIGMDTMLIPSLH